MNLKNIILTLIIFWSGQLFCMVQPPKPGSTRVPLPSDMKRYLIPFIASVKVHEVIDTIRALNATDRLFHTALQSEQIMLNLLDRMPFTINAIDLIRRLHKMPIMQSKPILQWRDAVPLTDGQLLYVAVLSNNAQRVRKLLGNKSIDLNWSVFRHDFARPLERAVRNRDPQIVKMLLDIGADPDAVSSCLPLAAQGNDTAIVKLLLASGANPDTRLKTIHGYEIATPKILRLIYKARAQRKQRLQQLLGKS
jgi:hypothetical protein